MEPLESTKDIINAIPREVALQICEHIREENRGKFFSFEAMQCRGCMRFSKGDPEKMRMTSKPDYRGCELINARYDARP